MTDEQMDEMSDNLHKTSTPPTELPFDSNGTPNFLNKIINKLTKDEK